MKKLALIITLISAMPLCAEDDEGQGQEKVTDIVQIIGHIQNLPTEEVHEAKMQAVNVMSYYCSIRSHQISVSLALRARMGQTIDSFDSVEEYGERITEVDQGMDKAVDAFVQRCGWMLE